MSLARRTGSQNPGRGKKPSRADEDQDHQGEGDENRGSSPAEGLRSGEDHHQEEGYGAPEAGKDLGPLPWDELNQGLQEGQVCWRLPGREARPAFPPGKRPPLVGHGLHESGSAWSYVWSNRGIAYFTP